MKPEIKVDGKDILDCDINELKAVSARLRWAYEQIQLKAKMKFYPGQAVWFNASRTGQRVEGNIVKINQKSISLDASDLQTGRIVHWKVSPSVLNPLNQ